MQTLIKGWEMFLLWFNLVVLNYINMYIYSHTHTHRSIITPMFKVNQFQSNKGRKYIDFEYGFSCILIPLIQVAYLSMVSLSHPCGWRTTWLTIHISLHMFWKGLGFLCLDFIFRADKNPDGNSCFSVACAWMYVYKCIRVILKGIVFTYYILSGLEHITTYYF